MQQTTVKSRRTKSQSPLARVRQQATAFFNDLVKGFTDETAPLPLHGALEIARCFDPPTQLGTVRQIAEFHMAATKGQIDPALNEDQLSPVRDSVLRWITDRRSVRMMDLDRRQYELFRISFFLSIVYIPRFSRVGEYQVAIEAVDAMLCRAQDDDHLDVAGAGRKELPEAMRAQFAHQFPKRPAPSPVLASLAPSLYALTIHFDDGFAPGIVDLLDGIDRSVGEPSPCAQIAIGLLAAVAGIEELVAEAFEKAQEFGDEPELAALFHEVLLACEGERKGDPDLLGC